MGVIQFPGKSNPRLPIRTQHNGGGGGGEMEARIAKLEANVAHIQSDIRDIKDIGFSYDLNDLNQVVFLASFWDGSSGVIVAQVPEPALGMLVLSVTAIMLRRTPKIAERH